MTSNQPLSPDTLTAVAGIVLAQGIANLAEWVSPFAFTAAMALILVACAYLVVAQYLKNRDTQSDADTQSETDRSDNDKTERPVLKNLRRGPKA